MEFIKDSFGDMLDDKDFLSWLSKKLEYKPNRLKSLLQDKAHNIRKSLQPKTYQDVYDFSCKIALTQMIVDPMLSTSQNVRS